MVEYKLDQVLNSYILENGETQNKYSRFLELAVSGLREMCMDFAGNVTTVHLPVSNIQTVALPSDYIQYTRIAICDGRGNMISLGLNTNMCLSRTVNACGSPQSVSSANNSTGSGAFIGGYTGVWEGFTDNFRNGEFMGRFFGIGGGNNAYGYYRIDRDNGVIQLGQTMATWVILEYLADLEQINGEFIVHPFLVQSLKEWIYWKSIAKNRSMGLGEKQLAEANYWKAYRTSVRRFQVATIEEWGAALRKANTAAPRF